MEDKFSQMTLSELNIDNINPEMSFRITLDNYEDNNINSNPSIDLISNDLKIRLKKDISESVMNLTQCFICLSIAQHPLSCPKCNNFACKKCLKDYFGDETEKKCPLCKNVINKNDLVKNKTIREIEKIIYSENKKSNKIKELEKLFEEKKKIWFNDDIYLGGLINRVMQYQENLKEYKKKYEEFIISWAKSINEVFKKYEKKIEDLLDLLLQYQQKTDNKDNNNENKINEKNNINNNKDINYYVNEILNLERNYFNDKNKINISKRGLNLNNINDNNINNNFSFNELIKKSNQFFIEPILIMPNISNYTIHTLYLEKNDYIKVKISKKDYNIHVGTFELNYKYSQEIDSYQCTLNIQNNRDVSFFPIQKKVVDDKTYDIITMKKNSKNEFSYNSEINISDKNKKNKIRIETKIQIFNVIG